MTSHLIVSTQPVKHILFLPSHFSPYYVTSSFFLRGGVIIQHFSRATICDPAEGPGRFPEHTAVTDALCSHAKNLSLTLKLFQRRTIPHPYSIEM